MNGYDWFPEPNYDYEPQDIPFEDDYPHPDPELYESGFKMLDGNLYRYDIVVFDSGEIEFNIERAVYTCWNGELPF